MRGGRKGLKKGFNVLTNVPVYSGKHERSSSSAFFSPLTGNYILSTTWENYYAVWDFHKSENGKLKMVKKIPHNNNTGQFLTPFRPVWYPQSEDIILSGSLKQPRQVSKPRDFCFLVYNTQKIVDIGSPDPLTMGIS